MSKSKNHYYLSKAYTKLVSCLRVVLPLLLCYGCASQSPTASLQSLAKGIDDKSQMARGYLIQPGDQLDIKFFYTPELNESVIVRPDGRISLQLIDDLQAGGLTPDQLDKLITKAYSSELRNPAVTVIVRSLTEPKVYVVGDITRPGFVTLRGKTGVLQAIDEAGGYLDSANISDISVIRKGSDNRPVVHKLDLEKILDGSSADLDFPLEATDVVYVPKHGFDKASNVADQLRKILFINGFFIPL